MGWTVTEAQRLGMGVDMTTGTGWCFGGPNVSDEDANASVVVKTFDLGVGERLEQKFDRKTTQALVAFSPDGKSIDLTDSIATNGEVFFSPPGNWMGTGTSGPPKTWKVYAISQKPSGQKVKRAAPGGEGWMLNPLYPPAMANYLQWFTDAFADYHGPKPRAQYQDSYEYRSDWSPDFFAQFEKRRGYKLQTELPALFGTEPATTTPPASNAITARPFPTSWSRNRCRSGWTGRTSTVSSRVTRRTARPAIWLDLYADGRHSRNGNVPHRPQHAGFQIRLVRRARAGRAAGLRRNRHLAGGTFHRNARRNEISRGRHVSLRREPHFLSRRLLFAGRGAAGRAGFFTPPRK